MVNIFDLFLIVLSWPEIIVVIPHRIFLLKLFHLTVHGSLVFVFILLEIIPQIVHGFEVVSVESNRWRLGDLERLSFRVVVEAVCHVEVILIYLSS